MPPPTVTSAGGRCRPLPPLPCRRPRSRRPGGRRRPGPSPLLPACARRGARRGRGGRGWRTGPRRPPGGRRRPGRRLPVPSRRTTGRGSAGRPAGGCRGRWRPLRRGGGAGRRDGQLVLTEGDVDAEADDDGIGAGPLGEDAAGLALLARDRNQKVVGPLEGRVDAGGLREAGGGGHAGEERQPAPAVDGHGGLEEDGQEEPRAGGRRPGAVEPAAARGLLLGDEHRALGQLVGPGGEVAVGGAGGGDHVERGPQSVGEDEGAAQRGGVQRGPFEVGPGSAGALRGRHASQTRCGKDRSAEPYRRRYATGQ